MTISGKLPNQLIQGASIDGAVIANCTQQYVVFVDETMFWTTIYLESEAPVNPRFTLQGEDGKYIALYQTTTPRAFQGKTPCSFVIGAVFH